MKSLIRSSWNENRVASCCVRVPKAPRRKRGSHLIAQYRGNQVQVLGARGGVRYTRNYDQTVACAVIRGDNLEVELYDTSRYVYDAPTGEFLWDERPTPPAGAEDYALAA